MTYKVIVYKGNFDSVEQAAYAEKSINWQNSKAEECNVCTECFAALDMVHILKNKKNALIEVAALGETELQGDVQIFIGEKCVRYACELYKLPFVDRIPSILSSKPVA